MFNETVLKISPAELSLLPEITDTVLNGQQSMVSEFVIVITLLYHDTEGTEMY